MCVACVAYVESTVNFSFLFTVESFLFVMMIFDNEKFSTLTTIFQMEKYLCWVLLLCGGIYATVVLNGSPFFSENTSDECGCATHDNYVNYV